MRRCPYCGALLREEGGLLVCPSCGFVADEGLSPGIDINRAPFTRRPGSVDNLANRLNLPEEVTALAKELLRAYDSTYGGGHTTSLIIAALITASRIYGVPIPIREALTRLSLDISPSRVTFYIGKVEELLPRKQGIPWEGYVNYLIAKMSRDQELMNRLERMSNRFDASLLLERLRIRAIREMKRVKNNRRSFLIGRNPVYIAAAVIYMASRKLGMRCISQGLLAELLGANRSTISKVLGLVR